MAANLRLTGKTVAPFFNLLNLMMWTASPQRQVPKRGREERHNEGDRPWENLSELALISPRTIFRSTPWRAKALLPLSAS
jgi:hypothetical protein